MTSPAVSVEDLSLRLGAFRLQNFNLRLEDGEILVILGPNGAGKSVSLETIAGFHRPDSGRIAIRGRDVTRLPPERRNVSLLFQDFGLFPHLTVAGNVAVGFRARREGLPPRSPAPAADHDVGGMLSHFAIAHLAARYPRELSPGEKQRVALARALLSRPDLFLFDEPFSALDARMRDQLRDELHAFLRGTGISAIFVTHDHADALTLADKLVVMREGEIVQSGSAAETFERPADRFVAEFLGIENILDGSLTGRSDDLAAVAVAGKLLHAGACGISAGQHQDVAICIRAEDVGLAASRKDGAAPPPDLNRLAARIVAISRSGALRKVELDCGFPLHAYVMAREVRDLDLAPDRTVEVEIEARAIHVIASSPGPRSKGSRRSG